MYTNDESVLNAYLKEINRIPLLSREEEVELAKAARDGDKAAREKILNANLRFVVNVAKKYQGQGLDFVDLISEGNVGLLVAVDKFDVDKGYHFISYAVWWIRQSILKAVCEKSRAIRLPLNKANELVQIERARKSVVGMKSEEDEIQEIAASLEMDSVYVREMLNLSKEMVSLDAPVSSDESVHVRVGDMIEDCRYGSPDEKAIEDSMKDEIGTVLGSLKPIEERVVRLRFGLDGEEPKSLKEVGEEIGLTKERIRQIEKKAIAKMQQPSRSRRLEGFVA